MLTEKKEEVSIRGLIDRRLHELRWAESEWNMLRPRLSLEDNDYLIIFPDMNREYNLYGMKYLDTFLQRRGGTQAVVLTKDSFVRSRIEMYSKNVKKIICLDSEQLDRLVELYAVYIYYPNVAIISLEKPFCRNAAGLIGMKDTTIEEMIAVGVYGIIPFRPMKIGQKIL